MLRSDSYNTILKPSEEIIFKDKGSKFYGYAYPLLQEGQVKEIISELKERHHKARHCCYAWKLGVEEHTIRYRVNDDGEPNNSAGQPIFGQILSKGLTNVLIVVVRYFGGTKLGISGLINAYKSAADMAISVSKVIESPIENTYQLNFEYKDLNMVMRVIKQQNLKIIDQKMGSACEFLVSMRKSDSKKVRNAFENLHWLRIIEI